MALIWKQGQHGEICGEAPRAGRNTIGMPSPLLILGEGKALIPVSNLACSPIYQYLKLVLLDAQAVSGALDIVRMSKD